MPVLPPIPHTTTSAALTPAVRASNNVYLILNAATSDEGYANAVTYLKEHYQIPQSALVTTLEALHDGRYFVAFNITSEVGDTLKNVTLDLSHPVAAQSATPSNNTAQKPGVLSLPDLALVLLQDTAHGHWGQLALPGKAGFRYVVIRGDTRDHDEFDEQDFNDVFRGVYTDGLTYLSKKYRIQTIVLVRYNSSDPARGATACLAQNGVGLCAAVPAPFTGEGVKTSVVAQSTLSLTRAIEVANAGKAQLMPSPPSMLPQQPILPASETH